MMANHLNEHLAVRIIVGMIIYIAIILTVAFVATAIQPGGPF